MSGWFYNSTSGSLNRVPTLLEGPYLAGEPLGWHELKISYNSTRDQAIAAAEQEFPGGATPGGSLLGNAAQDVVKAAVPKYSLQASGFSGWFMRGVKMIFGGILMILAVSRLTGLDNKVTQLASNIKVVPV